MTTVVRQYLDSRLAALQATGLLDSVPERRFDRLTRLVAAALDVPVSLISLVDVDRQFFKSAVGLGEPWASRRETPLSHSFCRFVVETDAPLIVNDSRENALVRDNPAIVELNVGAYLGVPIHDRNGAALGSLCAIEHGRRDWTPADLDILRDAAELVQREINSRREFDAVVLSAERWRGLLNTLPHMVWVANPLGHLLGFNDAWYAFTGEAPGEDANEPGTWLQFCHPDDRPAVRETWWKCLRDGTPCEMEFRLHAANGTYRGVLAIVSPVRDDQGEIEQWIGSCTDIQTIKSAQHAKSLILGSQVGSLIESIGDRAVYAKDEDFRHAMSLVTALRKLREEFA